MPAASACPLPRSIYGMPAASIHFVDKLGLAVQHTVRQWSVTVSFHFGDQK
ncbi:hypothetical protein E2C01_053386 [Portunus trituberculatus]|uniref:Uncharacterized protein n=1 Tax=Portunus trituberculatus TaxID=210409 RepID=A0A5B7GQM7_PORTR|nr:hypothetical protein [Portunus trituberculatus]